MFLGRIRDEIDQVEAANVPLPLPQDDHDTAQEYIRYEILSRRYLAINHNPVALSCNNRFLHHEH
jgi:hypothetical protein